MTTFTANKSKIKQKGRLNCSITQPAKTDLSPCSLPLGDVSWGGMSATQWQKLHTNQVKSVQNLVITTDWTTEYSHSFRKDWFTVEQSIAVNEEWCATVPGICFCYMNGASHAMQWAMNAHLYNSFTTLHWKTGTKVKMFQYCLIHLSYLLCMARFNIQYSIHVSLHVLCVPARLLYAIVHWLSFRHISSYESITKQPILWGTCTFFSIEEAFEFCRSSFADEHNT